VTCSPGSREPVPGQEGVATAARPTRVRSVGGLLTAAGLALAGFVTAPVAALVSRMYWRPGGVTMPYGLVISAAGSFAVVVLAGVASRAHAFVAAVGWLVGLALVVRNTPGGGFLVAGDGLGWAFLVVDTVSVGGALLWGGGRG